MAPEFDGLYPDDSDLSVAPVDYAARREARRLERKAERRRTVLTKIPSVVATSATKVPAAGTPIESTPVLGGIVPSALRGRAPKWAIYTVATLGALILVAALVVAGDYALSAGKIHGGVSVLGQELGGLTPQEAAAQLASAIEPTVNNEVTVTYEESSWIVTGAELGLTFDTTATVRVAYGVGRGGSLFSQISERWKSAFDGVPVNLNASFSEESSVKFIAQVSAVTNVEPVDSAVELADGKFMITEGSDGRAVVAESILSELPIAIIEGRTTYAVPVKVVAMGVTKANAQAAADAAAALSDEVLTVGFEDESWEFKPATVAKLFTFVREDETEDTMAAAVVPEVSTGVALVPVVSAGKVSSIVIEKVGTKVGTAPVDASFKTNGGSVTILPSKEGIGADPQRLASDILAAVAADVSPKKVAIVTTTVQPEVTTEEAQKMGIKNRISTFTTTFSSGNAPRVNNIRVLAESLDGTLIAPGGQFSFNGTVGERTAEKGYMEAGAIVNGELVNQLGGGICQVNTTLFNAVLLSGLPIDQRRNHSYYIDHYPLGRDATVSWGGPDFKFTNDLDTWVLVSTATTNGSVTISVYGTDPGYDVGLSTNGWETVKPHAVQEIKDKTLLVGKRVVETHGIDGGRVVLTRVVKKNGSQVRKDTFTSSYTTVTEVVRVGTKPKPAVVTPTVPVTTP